MVCQCAGVPELECVSLVRARRGLSLVKVSSRFYVSTTILYVLEYNVKKKKPALRLTIPRYHDTTEHITVFLLIS